MNVILPAGPGTPVPATWNNLLFHGRSFVPQHRDSMSGICAETPLGPSHMSSFFCNVGFIFYLCFI
jgi:hypothetical protein